MTDAYDDLLGKEEPPEVKEQVEEDISSGEKKVILIVTAAILLVTAGIFINSYLEKEKQVVVMTLTTLTTESTTEQKQLVKSEYYLEIPGFSYINMSRFNEGEGTVDLALLYYKYDSSYYLSVVTTSYKKDIWTNMDFSETSRPSVKKLVRQDPTSIYAFHVFRWEHNDTYFLTSSYSTGSDSDLDEFTSFVLTEFPPE